MLDGKRYFAEFPDEDPAIERPVLQSPELIDTLRALEKQLRSYIETETATGSERRQSDVC